MNTRFLDKCGKLSTFFQKNTRTSKQRKVQEKEKMLTLINILLYIYIYFKKIDKLPLFWATLVSMRFGGCLHDCPVRYTHGHREKIRLLSSIILTMGKLSPFRGEVRVEWCCSSIVRTLVVWERQALACVVRSCGTHRPDVESRSWWSAYGSQSHPCGWCRSRVWLVGWGYAWWSP